MNPAVFVFDFDSLMVLSRVRGGIDTILSRVATIQIITYTDCIPHCPSPFKHKHPVPSPITRVPLLLGSQPVPGAPRPILLLGLLDPRLGSIKGSKMLKAQLVFITPCQCGT